MEASFVYKKGSEQLERAREGKGVGDLEEKKGREKEAGDRSGARA